MQTDYPGRRIFAVSAQTGDGLDEWFETILTEHSHPPRVMAVDYARCGEGEALLGWLSASVRLTARIDADAGAEILLTLARTIMEKLEGAGAEVAHLKMSVEDDAGGMLRVQVTRNEEKPFFAGGLQGAVQNARLLINLRAEADPDLLDETVAAALSTALDGIAHEVTECAHFKSGQPTPTHRVAALA